MNKMYKYLEEHNYISKNENKDPLRQQELSISRAKCIANKYDSLINSINLINEIQQENQLLKETINKVYKLIEQHIRKDEFLELNEWQTRDLLNLLKEVSNE